MLDFSPDGVRRAMQLQAGRKARWLASHASGKLVSSIWSIALENPTFAQMVHDELVRMKNDNQSKEHA